MHGLTDQSTVLCDRYAHSRRQQQQDQRESFSYSSRVAGASSALKHIDLLWT